MDGTYNSWKLNRLASRRRLAYDSAFTVICREPFHTMICMELRQHISRSRVRFRSRKLGCYGLLVSPDFWKGCSDEDNLSATKIPWRHGRLSQYCF